MSKLNSALFVDFDNIFTCANFERLGNQFVTQISTWLTELSQTRNFNIKHVYMNPNSFSQFRKAFLEHGFKVIDCPPITGLGKTATDQEIAVDATMAMMTHPHIEEYMVISADADFTPVLRNARALGKKTSICFSGRISKCFTSVADCVYALSQLLSLETEKTTPLPSAETNTPQSPLPHLPAAIKKQLETALVTYLSHTKKPIFLGNVTNNGALKDIDIPKDRFGYPSLSALIEQLNIAPYQCAHRYLYHPAHFKIVGNYPKAQITAIEQHNNETLLLKQRGLPNKVKLSISKWLSAYIEQSDEPFHLSEHSYNTPIYRYIKCPKQYGFNRLRLLIKSIDLGELQYHSGYIYHPKKHRLIGNYPNCQVVPLPKPSFNTASSGSGTSAPSLSNKVDTVLTKLDVPLFNNTVFAKIFSFLSKGIALSLYCPKALSSFVATEVVKSGNAVNKKHIENIIVHLQRSGHYFSNNDSTKTLTNAFLNFIHRKCTEQKIPMSIKEQMQIRSLFIADKV